MELTKEEKLLIGKYIMDLESGNFLIRPRTDEYKKGLYEFCRIREERHTDKKSMLINEYADSCYYSM